MGSIRVAWWNLQNLFDTDDDPISADLEFTVARAGPEVLAAKLANLAVASASSTTARVLSCSASARSRATMSFRSCWTRSATRI